MNALSSSIFAQYITSLKHYLRIALLVPLLISIPFFLAPSTALAEELFSSSPHLSHSGLNLVDNDGRIVILHGLNFSNVGGDNPFGANLPNWFPQQWNQPDPANPNQTLGETWVQFFRANGFNAVRLSIFWAAVEPTPGHYDDAYIKNIAGISKLFMDNHIYVTLLFNQARWSNDFYRGDPTFTYPDKYDSGYGFPSWGVNTNGAPNPISWNDLWNALMLWNYNSALQNTYGNFYLNTPAPLDTDGVANGIGIQDRYVNMVKHVTPFFAGKKYFLGQEHFNESLYGKEFWTCFNSFAIGNSYAYANMCSIDPLIYNVPDCCSTNSCVDNLQIATASCKDSGQQWFNLFISFHNRLAGEIRALENGAKSMYVYDLTIDQEIYGGLPLMASLNDKNAGVSTQGYAFGQVDGNSTYKNYQQYTKDLAAQNNLGYFVNEIGSGGNGPETYKFFDSNNTSWFYYTFWDGFFPYDIYLLLDINKSAMDPSNMGGSAAIAIRTYPQTINGQNVHYSFDPMTKIFNLTYDVKQNQGNSSLPTIIATPKYVYQNGYKVVVKGAKVLSSANAPTLVLKNTSGKTVVVTVSPN